MTDNSRETVHEFAKNSTEVVRASVTQYRGKDYADLRVFFEAEDGEHRPTKKGITVAIDLVDELEVAVTKLKEAAER